jgi:hypothetical protein
LSGELKHDQLETLRNQVGELARGAAVRQLLVDVRALHHSVGAIDTLRLIESYAIEKPAWRTAVLETREQAQAHHFHETAAVNRGYKVLHFTDEAKAQAWLKS